jgi:hypothetical protein
LSLIINPTIKDVLGENFEINFIFNYLQEHNPYTWDNGLNITIKEDVTNPTSIDDLNVIYPITPQFPGWIGAENYVTDGTNFVSPIEENEGFVFRGEKPYHNILNWIDIKEHIIGDTDFLHLDRQFRYSHDTYVWSDWYDLNIDNLNEYASRYPEIYLEFKFVAVPIGSGFNTTIPFIKPTTIGWSKLKVNGKDYIFDRNFPDNGLTFKIGDTVLNSHSILFGTHLPTANSTPKEGDFIFLNPLFQGLLLNSITDLVIEHTEREIHSDCTKTLYLESLQLVGEKVENTTDALFSLSEIGERVVLTPPFLMKVFKITGFQLSVSGLTDTRTLDIQFRYSANRKKWSRWEVLTQENISTIKIDKLSFFYIEIAFTRTGTDEHCHSLITVNDLIFEGDIQNVSADYQKINKFGLRSDCDYCECMGDDCADVKDAAAEWKDPSLKGTFNPYEIYKNVGVYNKLANDVVNIYGWSVTYYTTAPDGGGKDRFLNEYQLLNYGEYKDIKVIPADNKFPESMLVMNGFDFALLESFEVHITIDVFKDAFGIDKRPAKKDRIWFCQANKLYEVEHSQRFKDFMNSSVYYKLKLKPATNDVSMGNIESTNLGDLMANNSHEALFGIDIKNETNKLTNKPFMDNLTEDVVRLSLKAPIVDYDLQNGGNLISRNYYNFNTLNGNSAIIYQKLDTTVEKSDDRTFMCWFNINDLKDNQTYNLINNQSYDGNGYDISYSDDELLIQWSSMQYEVCTHLEKNVWYAIIVTFNQRQHKLEYAIYKRFGDKTAGTHSLNDLDLVVEGNETLDPQSWNEDSAILQVKGSPMYYTNMRIFKTSIPKESHFKVLNQYIIKDTSQLLIADNANRKVITPKHKF